MKKKIIYAFFALATILASCNDLLDVSSPSVLDAVSVFQSASKIDLLVKSMYTGDKLLNDEHMYSSMMGSDIEFGTSMGTGNRAAILSYSATPYNAPSLTTLWSKYYSEIEIGNQCVKYIPSSPAWNGADSVSVKKYYGEAVTLRAFAYYQLMTIFGDVPFVTEPSNDENMYLGKTNRDSIYEYLIEDLRKVENFVPWSKDAGSNKRVTKGFVKGLRARMALQYAGYSLRNGTHQVMKGRYSADYYKIANQECKEIINSGKQLLIQSNGTTGGYERLFRLMHAYDPALDEVIFLKTYGRGTNGLWLTAPINSTNTKYGMGAGAPYTTPYFYYSFDLVDTRRSVDCELYNYSSASSSDPLSKQTLVSLPNNLTITKWRRDWIVPSMGGDLAKSMNTGLDWPIMRYSDILLMYAETENEINNGPTNIAKAALKEVRKRAFNQSDWSSKVDLYVDALTTKDAFFNAIVDERAWEFAGEGIRKFDLIRWNLLGEKILKMREENLKILTGTDPAYTFVPDYIYWKYDTDGATIIFLNKDYRVNPTVTDVTGWTKTSWFTSSNASTMLTSFGPPNGYAYLQLRGFDLNKNNYLQPIQSDVLSRSRGLLNNDQIP